MKFKLGNVLQQGAIAISTATILDTIFGHSDLSGWKCVLLVICYVGWMIGFALIDDYVDTTQQTIDKLNHHNQVLTDEFRNFVEMVKDNFR